jgi:rhodanese-related sulfurtransferase
VYGQPSVPSISVHDLAAVLAADPATPLVDVREAHEYAAVHVAGATSMPMSVVPVRAAAEIPRDRTVYVICHSGGRSMQASMWLSAQGYDVVNVAGGTAEWAANGLPVTTGP